MDGEEFRAELLLLLLDLLLLNSFSTVLPTAQESSGLEHLQIGCCIPSKFASLDLKT